MVRNDLNIKYIEDLKGKIIGVPFGSGPQPDLYEWISEAGLEINKDVSYQS